MEKTNRFLASQWGLNSYLFGFENINFTHIIDLFFASPVSCFWRIPNLVKGRHKNNTIYLLLVSWYVGTMRLYHNYDHLQRVALLVLDSVTVRLVPPDSRLKNSMKSHHLLVLYLFSTWVNLSGTAILSKELDLRLTLSPLNESQSSQVVLAVTHILVIIVDQFGGER